MTKLAIIGSGLAGKLAALYFSRYIKDIELVVIDPRKDNLPIVGESTVEITAQFLKSLDLSRHLEEEHYHKYGLTYYFRTDGDEDGYDYALHEAPGVIRLPAYNLNRWKFDRELTRRLEGRIVDIHGKVADIAIAPKASGRRHSVKVMQDDVRELTLEVDYIVDTSGRSRFLANKLSLKKAPAYQRSSYWLRLEDFDRETLTSINARKIRHHCFDSYYVTHHFYGHGYWIWIIPMRSENSKDLLSFGYTYRPEICGEKVMSFDRLCEILKRDHPPLEAFLRSGKVIDETRYYNYMYESEKYYSMDGWFLLGDAAFTFDPANSAGIAYLSHQIPQIASFVLKDRVGTLTEGYIASLEKHLRAQLALQDTWSCWYAFMKSPIKMAWTLLLANMGYFHIVVPNYMSGAFLNGAVARQFAKLVPRHEPSSQPAVYPFASLLDEIEATTDQKQVAKVIPALYEYTVPFSYYRPDGVSRSRLAARYFFKRAGLRLKAMAMLSWRPSLHHLKLFIRHGSGAVGDYLQAAFLSAFPLAYARNERAGGEDESAFVPPHRFLGLDRHDVEGDTHPTTMDASMTPMLPRDVT